MLKNPVKKHVDEHMTKTNQHLLKMIEQQSVIIANQEAISRRLSKLETGQTEVKQSMSLLEGQYANHMGILQDVVQRRRTSKKPESPFS